MSDLILAAALCAFAAVVFALRPDPPNCRACRDSGTVIGWRFGMTDGADMEPHEVACPACRSQNTRVR